MLTDLQLLRQEMDLLWGERGGPDLVIAIALDGVCVRTGDLVPEPLAIAIRTEVERSALSTGFGSPPPLVQRVRKQLEDALGIDVALAPGSGPTFVVEDHVSFPRTARVIRSDAGNVDGLRNANPGNWGADERIDLIEVRLGAWAMAVVDSRVVSICHTPVSNASAAEAGVWTHPEFRGRGHAAACSAAWAALMRPSDRRLFYSTSWTNRSSQRVAERLDLRHIGCTWQLRRLY